jgi:hypothetical protein
MGKKTSTALLVLGMLMPAILCGAIAKKSHNIEYDESIPLGFDLNHELYSIRFTDKNNVRKNAKGKIIGRSTRVSIKIIV